RPRRGSAEDARGPRLGELRDGPLQVADVLVPNAEECDIAVADPAGGIDEEDGTSNEPAGPDDAVLARDLLAWIREQRHRQPMLIGEALVGVDRLWRDPHHRQAQGLDAVAVVPVRAELLGAHRREVPRIEGEDHSA